MDEINIKKIIEEKNIKQAKKIPNFVYAIINWILCMKKVNHFLNAFGKEEGVNFASAVLSDMSHSTIKVIGLDKIPAERKYIFASNHPLGGLDGLAFIKAIHPKFPNLVFPVNDFLTFIPNLKDFFIPVNKLGSNSREASATIHETFESDKTVLMFPAGLCSRKINRKITDLDWKKTFVTQAINTKRDIVPVFIDGKNSNFFYNVAKLRKFLKIKFNVEMMLLPREMFKQKGKTIEIIIGNPIPYTIFDHSVRDNVWAQKIKENVYSLKQNINSPFLID